MPLYYFILKQGLDEIPDKQGEEFVDEQAAREHACRIARELMHGRNAKARAWSLQVRDENLYPLFDVLFARLDQTLDHLPRNVRKTIEMTCDKTASLGDTLSELRRNMTEMRATLARAKQIAALPF
ncbi:MAG: hypothetical protein JO237_12060 [Pseudolabrys sp.]|nr:hypothetical protein [Pseudolabrys sp.]